jgi:hypothetical protein
MARKKLSEMTPIERMNRLMKGLSWEEAEEVGAEIFARCLARHKHVLKDEDKFMDGIVEKISERCNEWSHEHSWELAIASVMSKRDKEKNDTNK